MPEEIGLFEAMHTQRAIRYFRPDPVPEELVRKILEAGIRAPSPVNKQDWAFIVIRDREIRERIAEHWRAARLTQITPDMTPQERKIYRGVINLAQTLQDIPVLIAVCLRHDGSPMDLGTGSFIYPAIQNMLLAARGLGLGSVLATRPRMVQAEVKGVLGIPENVELAAILPIGYPAEGVRYGPTRRTPVKEVTFHDRWGNP